MKIYFSVEHKRMCFKENEMKVIGVQNNKNILRKKQKQKNHNFYNSTEVSLTDL